MKIYEVDPRHPAMTAQSLKARGSCCKSGCLHCPYGFTLKKYGLVFHQVKHDQVDLLLSFTQAKIESKDIVNYRFIEFKEYMIGAIKVDHLFVKELHLLEEFQSQNISKEIVESYYFY